LPLAMDLDNPQIVTALRSGVLLCDLINAVAPNTVDTRVVNTSAIPGVIEPGSEVSAATENLQLALSAAQSIGCVIGSITAGDIEAGSPMKAMDIVWQAWPKHFDDMWLGILSGYFPCGVFFHSLQVMKVDLLSPVNVQRVINTVSADGCCALHVC
jgi:hypothetical protein